MKKQRLLTLAIVICLFACLFTACGDNNNSTDETDQTDYVVTIYPNNGDEAFEWKISDPIPNLTYEGHVLEGFYADSNFTSAISLSTLQTAGLTGNLDVYVKWKEEDFGCEHNIVIDASVPATCTEAGLTEGKHCSKCGEIIMAQNEVPELGHDIVEHDAQVPNCIEIGWNAYVTCTRCDYSTYVGIPTTDHSPKAAVIENDVAPTCTTVGSYDNVTYCGTCNQELSRESKIASATGHSHDAVATAPTCTESGYTTYTCHCGDTYIADEVPATGHNFEDNGYCSICSAEYYTEGLQFSLYSDGYVVTGINTNATDITIPSIYQGLPVTGIADSAFLANENILVVTIPDSVTSIGYQAFYTCVSLTSIDIPDSVTTIGDWAFHSCSSLTSVTIGNSVTTIGHQAFQYCVSLTSIDIPASVTSIGRYAFYECISLTSVTFGEKSQLTTIGYKAFHYCVSLTSIDIPDSVTIIGDDAFYYCDGLISVTFGENSQLTTIGSHAFYTCCRLTSIDIPDSVTSIGDFAFEYCTMLTSITISDSVTTIGENAFFACDSLTDVHYTGTEEQWSEIEVSEGNAILADVTIHYNYTKGV